ncbi:MAG: hypothetical protein ACREHG_02695 [Candidatus Saccharimonadales bacterium]
MDKQSFKAKRNEWLRRYIPAEVLGTATALIGAWAIYAHTNSFVAATAGGWFGEGIGFYGYFIATEFTRSAQRYARYSIFKRIVFAITTASTNLLVEFMPAEILDNFIIRPFAMYEMPHFIHPYPIGFLAGKFSADIIFYALAIAGYEARKSWLRH